VMSQDRQPSLRPDQFTGAECGDRGRACRRPRPVVSQVVADEVRALAETSEKSARDVQGLAAQIETQVVSMGSIIKTAATTANG